MTLPLAQGELLWITDDKKLYIGDGTSVPNTLSPVTGFTTEDAKDATAALFAAGTHSGITFTYNDSFNSGAGKIDAALNLADYTGIIRADAFKGSVFADDGSTIGGVELVNAVDGSINLDGTVKGNVIPDTNIAYDLGSATNRFRDLFLSGTSLHLGDAILTSLGSTVDLPPGSTIGGILIPSGDGELLVEGSNYNINIAADDSSILVNASTSTITASMVDSTDVVAETITINKTPATNGIVIHSNASGVDDVTIFGINSYHATATANGAFFNRARGSYASPTAAQAGDDVFNLGFSARASDGNNYPAAFISAEVTAAGTTNGFKGKLKFTVSDDTGVSPTVRLTVDHNGIVGFTSTALTAGGGSGQVISASVSTWMKVTFNGVNYALPLYALNP